MADILANVFERVGNLAMETLHDCVGLREKMQTLTDEVKDLTDREADVLAVLEEEEIRSGKKRKREVEDWLVDVTRKRMKCDNLDQQVQRTRFYHFRTRLHLGKCIKEVRLEVEKLAERCKFPDGLFLEVCSTKGKPLVTAEWRGQHASRLNFMTVWGWLMDSLDDRIGIYGMGGVGKTTLAMRIHNKLLKEPKFKGHVYWVHVSLEADTRKLQNDIAGVLNLELSGEGDDNVRAAQLFAALKRRRTFVLILDDVWDRFDIEKVGIPLGRGGGKLLITSRSVDVCHKIGCQKNIKVEILNEEEAWVLFLDKVGHGVKFSPEMEIIAKEVVKRCAGLPLGIITMGGSMRGVTDVHEWRDALEELKESSMRRDDMETEVFPILLCSFNRLRDPKLQNCFLYCCLYPEDFQINRDELISKFIVEELMDERNSRQAYFDQGHAILNKLENASLLERSSNNSVKMHDLIRDMAFKLTKDKAMIMVKAGIQLCELPDAQEWKAGLNKISLMCNKVSNISPHLSFNCPMLSTLILRRNPLETIPHPFFLHMHGLKVLDLSYTWIEALPSSISDLENLNALLLTCCLKLRCVPPLTKLKALKELDLSKTQITELPSGMQNLVSLKSLNIGYMSCLETIPESILPNLSSLQRLIVTDHLPLRAEQLQGLKNLEEFQGLLCSVDDLSRFVSSQQKFGKLSFYNIAVGEHDSWSRDHPESKRTNGKFLTFNEYCFFETEKALVPQDIRDLRVAKCSGLKNCLSDIFVSSNNLRTLKSLRIFQCTEIECILSLPMNGEKEHRVPFQSLEKIILSWLCNLTSLVKCDDLRAHTPLRGTFSVLKELRIQFCNKIKRLFTLRMVQSLHNLEDVYVSECAEMEEIIGDDEECIQHIVVTLPKLRALSVKWMPKLKSIYNGKLLCDSVEVIGLFHCHELKRLPFSSHNGQPSLGALKQLRISIEDKDWWESLEWNHPDDKIIFQPFVKCLNLGLQSTIIDPGWKKMLFVFLFIRRLQVRSRS